MSDHDAPEYVPEVTGGRGYLVSIPRFFGDSAVQMNKFYGTLAGHVTKYFERLCGAHRSLRCSFEVSGTAGARSAECGFCVGKRILSAHTASRKTAAVQNNGGCFLL